MSGSDESVALSCSLKLSFLDSKGTSTRQLSNAKSHLVLGRNEFRDIIMKIQCGTSNLSFGMKNMELHTRFVKEGKATIKLPDPSLHMYISNCPTAMLGKFLKTLMAKVEKLKCTKPVGLKDRLLSNKTATFQEISPLTNLDLNVMKSKRVGKDCPQTPTSTKRKETPPSLVVERPLAPRPLTQEQRLVMSAVLSGRNVFFTGSAGTGKSFLLKRILGALAPEGTFATASTGVAACQIGGMTLHAFAGIGTGSGTAENYAELCRKKGGFWKQCRHLVVDEVSMVDGLFFQKLEEIARLVRNNDKPFGGIQLILSGDFLQLPPVTKPGEKRLFCFQANAWENCIDVNIELSQVKRQKDKRFIDILQNVRRGKLTQDVMETLRATAKHAVDRDGILATKLSTHKDDVELINRTHLGRLTGEAVTYVAEDNIPSLSQFISAHCQVGHQLELKVGTQVMLTKNLDVPRGLVNGARGVVTAFDKGKERLPVVQFVCGAKLAVRYERWTFKAPSGVVLTRKMLPLQLAWAMSIHKSQQEEEMEESLRRWWNAPAKAKGTAFVYKAVEHMRRDYDNFMRMTPEQFDRILRLILADIAPKGTRQLSDAKRRLAIVLKYLVSGDSLSSLSFYSGVSPRILRSYVKLVCDAIWRRLTPMVLPLPKEETWKKAAEEINRKWQFPNCVGAIDVKEVAMQAPADEGCEYLNHKGSYSLALLAICDANCKFLHVEIGDTCRKTDEDIYRDSKFYWAMKNGKLRLPSPAIFPGIEEPMPYVFAGDAAFLISLNMMKPFSGKILTYEDMIFNYRLSRVQCLIEYAFSIMSSRYRVFESPIAAKADIVIRIVRAAVVLHNFLIDSENVVIPDRM